MVAAHRFVAAPGDPRDRLDRFLVACLERVGAPTSRATVQRWIDAGRALIDGRVGSASQRIAAGAVVDVAPLAPEPTHLEPDAGVAFEVLYEDDDLVVVDKPGGLVVHPARGHATGTLVHGLLARGSFAFGAGDPDVHARPGIVHRLDKGTSGILVVARNETAREGLKAQFARHDIERAYLAIVVGRAKDATHDTLHGRHRTDRLKFTTRVRTGKRAVTHVRVVERLPGDLATLVECRIETGRTHQIRVHLAECSMTAVLGDPLYGRSLSDPLLSSIAAQLGRQALHATVLGFCHPLTGERLHFRREPPTDFMTALRVLREAVPKSRS